MYRVVLLLYVAFVLGQERSPELDAAINFFSEQTRRDPNNATEWANLGPPPPPSSLTS
jgi:hypothetical protein